MELLDYLPSARAMEGCPLGTDEAVLALASPPLYTPFPNPFVEQFLSGTPGGADREPYTRSPIALDVSEGRTDSAYMAQNYHTKVPYRAIVRYLEHFTERGDVVLDGFCGSGMVGVAANQSGRRAILCDLSPAASLIAHSFCHPIDLSEASTAFSRLLEQLERECGWLYQPGARGQGPGDGERLPDPLSSVLDYVIWSEVFRCPRCSARFPFSQAGFDFQRRRPLREPICPDCGAALPIRDLPRSLDETGRTREVPVRVAYVGRGHPTETAPPPDLFDLQKEIERRAIPYWYPDQQMMQRVECPPPGSALTQGEGLGQPSPRPSPQGRGRAHPSVPGPRPGWGDMWRRGYHSGMERVSDFYFKRSLWALAAAIHLASRSSASIPTRQLMLQAIVNASTTFTRMRRAYQGVLPLVLYVPKLKREVNVIRALASRFRSLLTCLGGLRTSEEVLITTQSTTSIPNLPDCCVDYIFTDPPFGDNIRYSEVNFLWEAWLGVFTNQGPEAIISPGQAKGIAEYQELMRRSFAEMHRVLKPGRWITVAFHNSDHRVWNAIQQALQEAGFQVADVRLLDKQQVSFKQASAGTVRHDLVISARKAPVGALRAGYSANRQADGITSAWDYVRERLRQLPIPEAGNGKAEAATERQGLELFNRMVADHLRRGVPVPLDSQQFREGLRRHFEERDGMYFLPEQAAEYDPLAASSRAKI